MSQVFDEALWPAVIANLTGPDQRAIVRNLSVRENVFLGVDAYVLDELYLVSLEKSPEFLALFTDPEVAAHVPDAWPSHFPVSMDDFSANLMGMFVDWKVQTHWDELAEALG